MYAQRLQEVGGSVSRPQRRRQRPGPFAAVFNSPIVCLILLASVLCFGSIVYISAYARVYEKGCRKADLVKHLNALRLDNEQLRLDVEKLRQPDRIASFALAGGMKQSEEMAYLKPVEHPAVAQNVERIDER